MRLVLKPGKTKQQNSVVAKHQISGIEKIWNTKNLAQQIYNANEFDYCLLCKVVPKT